MWGDRLFRLFEKCENAVFVLLFSAICLMLMAQALLTHDKLRYHISYVERLEGKSLADEIKVADYSTGSTYGNKTVILSQYLKQDSRKLTIRWINYQSGEKVVVRVNGKINKPFASHDVAVYVEEGDLVEIDATNVDRKLRFVVDVSDHFAFPVKGLLVELEGGIQCFDRIRFK